MSKLKRKLRDLTVEEIKYVRTKSMREFMLYIKKSKVIDFVTVYLAQDMIQKIIDNNIYLELARVNKVSVKTIQKIAWEQEPKRDMASSLVVYLRGLFQ